jgi:3-oxoacyl-[acyl-carrier protein] reductase
MDRHTNRIQGQVALVTGGTRGIGHAISKALLEREARVFVCATGQRGVDAWLARMTPAHPGAIAGAPCDVRRRGDVRAMMQAAEAQFGGLDILVNNAGIGVFSPVEKMSVDDWDRTLGTNLSGVFYCCREAIPLLKRRGGGYIINIGSLAGKNAFAGGAAYNASKFGLIGFSEALMQDVRYDHIRVSCVMPGSVDTGFGGSGAGAQPGTWKLLPEDVAQVVVSLLDMDPRALPSRVELRPSEPKK